MAAQFGAAVAGPAHISAEPHKDAPPDKVLQPGLEHRPFSDEEIKQAFDTFDLDKNRFVGAAELSHILKLIGEEVTDEEIDEMIRICDGDGDGQVTFDEFYKLMTNPPPPVAPYNQQGGEAVAPRRRRGNEARKTYYGGASAAGGGGKPAGAESVGNHLSDGNAQSSASRVSRQQQANAVMMIPTDEKADKDLRANSVEFLIKKLSGGLGKIKPSQIKKVYKRFQDIDVDKSGAIDYMEFIRALEMEDNTISRQMFRVFDMDGSNCIELKEFIVVLSRYTSAATSEKLKFAFMMFDEDGSGYMERDELIQMLAASFVVEGFSHEELEERADMVFNFLNKKKNGKISYEDFMKLSTAKNGLIYPVESEKHVLGKDLSINALLSEARSVAE